MPDGFATTSEAYRDFISQGGLATRIAEVLRGNSIVEDVTRLAEIGARSVVSSDAPSRNVCRPKCSTPGAR